MAKEILQTFPWQSIGMRVLVTIACGDVEVCSFTSYHILMLSSKGQVLYGWFLTGPSFVRHMVKNCANPVVIN